MFNEVEPEYINETKFLWGKNYTPNSSIKFEYYLETLRSSYPDFIMKDSL
jgi:type III restriction enzyme